MHELYGLSTVRCPEKKAIDRNFCDLRHAAKGGISPKNVLIFVSFSKREAEKRAKLLAFSSQCSSIFGKIH